MSLNHFSKQENILLIFSIEYKSSENDIVYDKDNPETRSLKKNKHLWMPPHSGFILVIWSVL